MVQHVIETGGHADRGERRMTTRERHHPGTHTEQDDADVFDAVIGEEALEVVLHQRIEHAENGRQSADQKDEDAPRQSRQTQTKGAEPNDAVDPSLDQDAGHQRRNTAGRGGMRFRQPDVQWDDARLHGEAEKEKHEDGIPHGTRDDVAGEEHRERDRPRRGRQDEERRHQRARRHVRHHQIQVRRPPSGAYLVLRRHQRGRGQCHQLPGEEEGDHVAGDEDELDGEEQDVEGDAEKHGPLIERRMARVADAEERDRHGEHRQHHEEPGRQGVDRIAQGESRRVMDEQQTVDR